MRKLRTEYAEKCRYATNILDGIFSTYITEWLDPDLTKFPICIDKYNELYLSGEFDEKGTRRGCDYDPVVNDRYGLDSINGTATELVYNLSKIRTDDGEAAHSHTGTKEEEVVLGFDAELLGDDWKSRIFSQVKPLNFDENGHIRIYHSYINPNYEAARLGLASVADLMSVEFRMPNLREAILGKDDRVVVKTYTRLNRKNEPYTVSLLNQEMLRRMSNTFGYKEYFVN